MKKALLLALILIPNIAFAQRMSSPKDYVLLEPLPCIQNTGQGETEAECAEGTLIKKISTDTYIAYIFNFAIAFAGVAAVIVIMVAGFQYAVSDIISSKSAARERIKNAIIGLVTVICSYFILELVDPRLVNIDTQLEVIEAPEYAFDYNALLNTAQDYRIRQDLENARVEMRPMEKEARLLREQAIKAREEADRTTDPARAQELRNQATANEQKALTLEKEYSLIGSRAALKATADQEYEIIDKINGSSSSVNNQLELIQARKASIAGQADKDIKKLTDLGNLEGAQTIKEDKDYYLAKFDQDIVLKSHVSAVESFSENYLAKYGTFFGVGGALAGTFSNSFAINEAKQAIELIRVRQIPENITTENRAKLEADKQAAIKKITDLITPKP